MSEARTVIDLQVWDDADTDPYLYENIGDVRIVEHGILIILEKVPTPDKDGQDQFKIVSSFNANGWLRYETSERIVVEDQG